MRSNSGQGESSNNNRDPTLKEHERDQGRSGEAIAGEKEAASSADRIDTTEKQGG